MNKTEIGKLIRKEFEDMFNEKLKQYLKKPEIKKIIKDYNKESLTDFVRSLWTQRSFWENKI